MIQFLIESYEGHTESLIPNNQIAEKTNEQIAQDKWATVEKTDGTTQTVTKEVPKENWNDVFGKDGVNTKSVAVTSKMKGG